MRRGSGWVKTDLSIGLDRDGFALSRLIRLEWLLWRRIAPHLGGCRTSAPAAWPDASPPSMSVLTDGPPPSSSPAGMPSAWRAAKLRSLVRNTVSMCLASVALSLFLSGKRRLAHNAAASPVPTSLSSASIWSRSRPESSKLRRTDYASPVFGWRRYPTLTWRGSGVRAARFGARLSRLPMPSGGPPRTVSL